VEGVGVQRSDFKRILSCPTSRTSETQNAAIDDPPQKPFNTNMHSSPPNDLKITTSGAFKI
jgi:hypothetical protein